MLGTNSTFVNIAIGTAIVIVAFFVGLGLFFLIIAFLPGDKSDEAKQKLREFFGVDLEELSIVTASFYKFEFPNLQLGINEFLSESNTEFELLGVSTDSLQEIVDSDSKLTNIRYCELDLADAGKLRCAENGLYVTTRTEQKFAIFFSFSHWKEQLVLEVMAESPEQASSCLESLRESISAKDVFRGKVIALESSEPTGNESGWAGFRLQSLRCIDRDEIILPQATMELIERNSIRFFQHTDCLRAAGQDVKRGLLFHGPPGTGKTLVAQWIAQSLENTTVVLVSGEQLWQLKECCRIARLLAPSLIMLEDVDLIATAREDSAQTTALHQLLNEMDGTAPQTDVLYLLTTNVPDAIEPALANRPGRIDQAIEFPLPDLECRRRLMNLFGRNVGLDVSAMREILTKTESATPAFLKELVRKAIVFAAEEQRTTNVEKMQVREEDLKDALREMTLESSGITRRIFGFSQS